MLFGQVMRLKPHPEKDYVNVSTRILEPTTGDMVHNQQEVYENAERLAADAALFAEWK